MKKTHSILIVAGLLSLLACNTKKQNSKDSDSLVVENPYFGEKQPGIIPKIFAPGAISINGRYEHGISFSPKLDEVYFSANKKDEDSSIYFQE